MGIVEKTPSSGHVISFEMNEKQLSATSLYCILDFHIWKWCALWRWEDAFGVGWVVGNDLKTIHEIM
jgi:hypothetical protein